jgi:hypothetical protein
MQNRLEKRKKRKTLILLILNIEVKLSYNIILIVLLKKSNSFNFVLNNMVPFTKCNSFLISLNQGFLTLRY